jgi:hypothetical protein
VNLRKDHYRVHALRGRPPTLEYYTFVALAGRQVYAWLPAPAGKCLPEDLNSEFYVV